MPKFKKQIVSDGLYVVSRPDGSRAVELITPKRIKHWVDQHRQMKAAGIKLPAPAFHGKEFNPNDTTPENNSKNNFGFWEELEAVETLDEKGNPTTVMSGIVDVPVPADAEKVGKTVQETSIYTMGEFVDGRGRKWHDVPVHIALVNKPIEPGQENFEPVSEDNLAISMSHRLPIQMDMTDMNYMLSQNKGAEREMSIDDLCELLEQVAGISIPKGTSTDDLYRALMAALKQKELDTKSRNGGTVTNPPDNSYVNEVPVVMSQQQQTAQPAGDTAASQKATDDVIMSLQNQLEQTTKTNAGLVNALLNQKKADLKNRLSRLQKTGIVSTEDATAMQTEIESMEMSFTDSGDISMSNVESNIRVLEKVKVPMPANRPAVLMADQGDDGNFVVQPHQNGFDHAGPEQPLAENQINDVLNNLFGSTTAQ